MASKPTTTAPKSAPKTAPKKAKRSTTRAAATTPKAAAKTAAKAPKAHVVSTKAPVAKAQTAGQGAGKVDAAPREEMTKKDIVAAMMAASGMKKGDARRAMEATMAAIADALAQGKDLSLPPLGKIKIARTKDTPNGKLVVLRAKLKEPQAPVGKDPLAEAAE